MTNKKDFLDIATIWTDTDVAKFLDMDVSELRIWKSINIGPPHSLFSGQRLYHSKDVKAWCQKYGHKKQKKTEITTKGTMAKPKLSKGLTVKEGYRLQIKREGSGVGWKDYNPDAPLLSFKQAKAIYNEFTRTPLEGEEYRIMYMKTTVSIVDEEYYK